MSLLELHLLGTGTSGCIPAISCITDPDNGCECCVSTMRPEGVKNIRRNTSALIQVKRKHASGLVDDSKTKTILIDCGKSFLTSALEWFPKKKFRRIDALIITHAHSDAMSGLDDLRGWTLGGAIQPTMDIYVTQQTFQEIQRTYPYLVSKELATGGGDVPAMNWIIFDENNTFDVCGVTVTPLPVHHGVYFIKKEPYWCLGFMFNRSIVYISDVSFIPESTWELLEGSTQRKGNQEIEAAASSKDASDVLHEAKESLEMAKLSNGKASILGGSQTPRNATRPQILLIDCLRVYPHTSHFGFAQAVATARRLQAKRTYTLGFAHRVTHATWERAFAAVSSGQRPSIKPQTEPGGLQSRAEKMSFGAFNPKMRHSDNGDELIQIALESLEEWEGGPKGPIRMQPCFDGLMISVDEATGECADSSGL